MISGTTEIVVVGSINLDIVTFVEHFPQPGETIIATDNLHGLGGKGANQAVAAQRAGANVRLIGALGDDEFNPVLRKFLEETGVHLGSVVTMPGRCGVAYITVDSSGENTIIVSSGVNHDLDVDRVIQELSQQLKDSSQTLLLQGELSREVNHAALAAAKQVGVQSILNLAPYTAVDFELLQHVSYLIVNESEALALALHLGINESSSASMILSQLSELLPCTIIMTLGAEGATYSSSGETWIQPSPLPAQVVDTTGAGDAFVGAFTHHISRGLDMKEAVRYAVAAGSLAVESAGTIASYPSNDIIASRLSNTKEPTCLKV